MQPEEAHSGSPLNGESKPVAQKVSSSLTPGPVDVMPRKHRNEDHNLNLGTLVEIPKLDTYSMDLENVAG